MARWITTFPQEFKIVSGDAVPAVGYKRAFFDTDGTTPKATYSDSALTNPNPNPIELDSNGRTGDVFLATGGYVMTLRTDDDVLVYTADPLE
jgi:hypothetical protein